MVEAGVVKRVNLAFGGVVFKTSGQGLLDEDHVGRHQRDGFAHHAGGHVEAVVHVGRTGGQYVGHGPVDKIVHKEGQFMHVIFFWRHRQPSENQAPARATRSMIARVGAVEGELRMGCWSSQSVRLSVGCMCFQATLWP